MKKLTRKLFISILSMAFAVIAIGTTTFAWITVSNTATVNQFGGSVEAGVSGIELSVDEGVTWQSNVSLDDLIKDAKFTTFSDVTTNDGETFKEYTFSEKGGSDISAEGKYINISFLIRRSDYASQPSEALPVYVENVAFSNNESGNLGYKLEYDLSEAEGENVLWAKDKTYNFLRVENAARLLISVGQETVVYEQKLNENGNTLGYSETGFAHLYWSKKNPTISLPKYEPEETDDGTIGNPYQAGTTSDAIVELGNSPEGYKVTVKVWVEGFDNECHARILSQGFKINFGFTTTKGTTPSTDETVE